MDNNKDKRSQDDTQKDTNNNDFKPFRPEEPDQKFPPVLGKKDRPNMNSERSPKTDQDSSKSTQSPR